MALFTDLGKKKTGVMAYVLLLVLAVIVLFYIAYTSFRQNRALRDSTELVTHTQEVINEINMLFGNYMGSESAGIKYLISNDSTYLSPMQGFKDKSALSSRRLQNMFSDNSEQLARLERVPEFSDQLFEELKSFDPETAEKILQSNTLRSRIEKIEGFLDSLETIKSEMVKAEYARLKERRQAYESEVQLTPLNILYSSLFALGILMFAFSRINTDRRKLNNTQSFLRNVLQSTNNIINYYRPIRDKSGTIKDFEIIYTNIREQDGAGVASEDAIGKRLTQVYPQVNELGVVPFLAEVVDRQRPASREVTYNLNGRTFWFTTSATPLSNGVSTTVRDITKEKETQSKLEEFNRRLETQNLELEKTSGFLKNLLTTLQYVITYLEAVRDDKGKIVDFKFVYSNEKIKEWTGMGADELIGQLLSDANPPAFENGDFETFIKVIDSGESHEFEKLYALQMGDFYICNEVAKLGDGVTIVSRDVSLRKDAERQLRQVNDDLELQNTILNDAEIVAGIGSYNWDLTSDNINYSSNLYRLFGYEANGFKPSYKRFMTFVHSDDRKVLEENNREIFEQKKAFDRSYRIKTKNGKTKHVQATGHFIEKNNDSFMVGVVRDITSQRKSERELKAKNRELLRSNAELESFNRVASHDLQEPLRKIQMFISRLSEFDKDNLSEKGADYLEKIESSANRMQYLIRNLLTYSRVADESAKQVKVDLESVFEKVLDDHSEKIRETQAQINLPELPVVYGIGFQLERLFSNLISNSLKYKKHDQPPKINITSEILTYDQVDPDLKLPRSRYVKLTLQDNGIGFDQQYSDKIFKLFERLHAKNAFTGTGLGLAICKKIADNHRGHIAAFGKHNEGTRMEVYLPYRKTSKT
ncbi:MAG: PAS domain S-box protein [Pricia sp.]